jgi:ADP-heptose:LPS heptosyltransferase
MTSRSEKVSLNLNNKFRFFKELRREKYDLIIDLTGNFWTAFASWYARPGYSIGMNFLGFGFFYNHESEAVYKGHLIDKYLNIFITSNLYNDTQNIPISRKTQIHISKSIESKIDELFISTDLVNKKIVVIHTTAGWKGKQWDIEKFIAFIKLLPPEYTVVIIGGKSDAENALRILQNSSQKNIIDLTGKISIIESAEVIKRAQLFIGADSGPLYIAQAVGTPTIGLFGPTNPLFSAPRGENHTHIYHELFCSADKNEQYCKLLAGLNCRTHDCMHLIKPDDVTKLSQKMLNNE